MSAPRHLWSDDWRRESAAAAEELARRRALARAGEPAVPAAPAKPAEPERPAAVPPAEPERPAAVPPIRIARLRAHPALTAFFVTLLSAIAAFAFVSLLDGTSDSQSPASTASQGWLGVAMAPFTSTVSGTLNSAGIPGVSGVVITSVSAHSPAATAGLEPGDVLAEVNNQPVSSPADVEGALAGLRAGDRVQIQYQRGAMSYATQVTLATRPAGSP